MKLAIHQAKWGFSLDWIAYCQKEGFPYKIVDCYSSDIIKQLEDCQGLLWHHHHSLAQDKIFAKQLLFALQQAGIRVFPDFNTGWHFDDKLGQKYLLEVVGAPSVPTEAFYDKESALRWINSTFFPKVFKLRGGAGSSNVKLVHTKKHAAKLVKIAFGAGFPSYDKIGDLRENIRQYKLSKVKVGDVLKSIRRIVKSTEYARIHGKEKGYVLFQDFVPNNKFDIRVITIANRAFAIKRFTREGDFRASGSGFISYSKEEIDERCVQIAFDTTHKLQAQCVAYDFVFDQENNPLIVEVNYGFAHTAYFPCPGYWDKKLNWHKEKFNPAHWLVDLLIDEINK